MKRDVKLFLSDIIECIERIEEYIKNVNKERFLKEIQIQDAVMRRLEIIGEAAKNVPEKFRKAYSDTPWKRIAGMRDILTHVYFGVKLERVWIVINEDLPNLKEKIRKILEEIEE